jgi:hypothetical protein
LVLNFVFFFPKDMKRDLLKQEHGSIHGRSPLWSA